MKEELIAPCGMNCALCMCHLAMVHDLNKQGFKRTYCPGCLPRGKGCLHMGDVCETLGKGLVRFCFECASFPCKRLKNLDRRYRTKYHMSMIANLRAIQEHGIDWLLQRQEAEWKCPTCGDTVCCHNGLCLGCQVDTLREHKTYRWGE
jgi:hypothetical protein